MLRPDQEKLTNGSIKLLNRHKRIVAQSPTGGGKTYCFSAMSHRYINKRKDDVMIVVHRKELLTQTKNTLFNIYGINPTVIIAGTKHIKPARVYVVMVESAYKRLPKIPTKIGLLIIDECHEAIHNKMLEHFPESYIIGFSATPISSSKKNPLNKFYEEIICGADIQELIKIDALCQNITYAPREVVERSGISVRGNDFNDVEMSQMFSKPKYIHSTVQAYEKHALGKKTIIFNVDIAHSLKVCEAFKVKGYQVRHLDGTTPPNERRHIFNWFHTTPDAILCNVGVATTGFDEPSIECVIFNKSTMSLSLWLQCTGRGSRPFEGKTIFIIIDMGENAITHGDWNDKRDWSYIFHHPPKPGEKGVAPVKNCPNCDAIIHAGAMNCPYCQWTFEKVERAEPIIQEYIVITKNINVEKLIASHSKNKEYYTFFDIGTKIANNAKKNLARMDNKIASDLSKEYFKLAEQWCKIRKKDWNNWHKEKATEHLYELLEKNFSGWKNPFTLVG